MSDLRRLFRTVVQALAASVAFVAPVVPALAAPTPDVAVPAVLCNPPSTGPGYIEKGPNYIRYRPGRNPPPSPVVSCPLNLVGDGPLTLTLLGVVYVDPDADGAGRAEVRLMATSLGALATDPPIGTQLIAASAKTVPSPVVNTAHGPITTALDPTRFVYSIEINFNAGAESITLYTVLIKN